ncbi:MAG: BMC domain-containing protein [Oscillospiraceae bacterium]|nr:BMC domain-containing protein [Oscillospiraceae bacterium]MBQ3500852.1 BMC domain-containing protein [Oscillospiraceae bacterium]MBQ4547510.1 BMC domain-containing protein [Oscillospiraceae bacterium]MBQ4643102.1 BMC domain-containing protein [Oscillospiraceae bacterium]MBQ7123669.1 BMC domain-containing protein [Oscillospiraceae bacterium]
MSQNTEYSLPPRSIQEYVPGKQVTLAHRISKPDRMIYKKLGLTDEFTEAIGIITITPSESAIIAADICTKAARIKLGFVDRFSGAVVFVGEIGAVDSALNAVIDRFEDMKYSTVKITRS